MEIKESKEKQNPTEEADAEANTAASAEAEGRTKLPQVPGLHHRKLPRQPFIPFSLLSPFHLSLSLFPVEIKIL